MQNPTEKLSQPDNRAGCAVAEPSAPLTGGCLLARGGRVLRHGEVVREGDYTVNGGLVNPATPVPSEWVGRPIFDGLPQPSVIRVPNKVI
jgi:hypothetical protein